MSLSNVQIAEQENECKDATEDLEESKKFFAELEVNCESTELAEHGNMADTIRSLEAPRWPCLHAHVLL